MHFKNILCQTLRQGSNSVIVAVDVFCSIAEFRNLNQLLKNAGHFPKHSAINSILKRSLTHINLPSTLKPECWQCWLDKGQTEA